MEGEQLGPGPWDESEDEKGMEMRWKWRWNENYSIGARDGERKRRRGEEENTNTNTPGPERANLEKARKKKSGGRRKRTKTRGGGGRRTCLNQPTTAKPKPTQARKDPNLPGEGSKHEIRDQWGLVDETTKTTKGRKPRDSAPANIQVVHCSFEVTAVDLPRRACNAFPLLPNWVHNWMHLTRNQSDHT